MKQGGEDANRSFAYDMIVEVLSRLPVKSVFRFKTVCKQWCSLIHNPTFIRFHFSRSNHTCLLILKDGYFVDKLNVVSLDAGEDDPTTYVVKNDFSPNKNIIIQAHCNGLIFYFTQPSKNFWVCNLSTKQQIKLPQPPFRLFLGFGFNPSTNEYTIVLYTYYYGCHLFTLGTTSWRSIASRTSKHLGYYCKRPVSINGVLHWNSDHEIICFHLNTEEFGVIPHPTNLNQPASFYIDMYELQGTLCLFYADQGVINLWVLNDYINHSWDCHRFIIVPCPFAFQNQMIITRNWDILTVSSTSTSDIDGQRDCHYLHSYNLHTYVSKKIKLIVLPSSINSVPMGGEYKENMITLKTTG